MSLIWIDGFDAYNVGGSGDSISPPSQYDATAILRSSEYVDANNVFCATDSRTGRGRSLRFAADTASNGNGWLRKAFPAKGEIVAGFAYKYVPTTLDEVVRFEYDNLFGSRNRMMSVYINGNAGLTISVGSNNPVAYSPPNIIFPNVWHYVEVKYKPRVSGGRIVVRVDGVTFIDYNGKTKPDDLPEVVNTLFWGQSSGEWSNSSQLYVYNWIDDLYVLDTTGTSFNDFLGDVVVHSMMPASDEGPNQGNQFGGGLAKFTAIDEIGPDEDLSYIYSNTVGVKEMFGINPLPDNIIDVLAVGVCVRAKKDAAGISNYKICARLDSIEEQSAMLTAPTQYITRQFILETKPGGGAWDKEAVEDMHFGFELF